MRIPVRAVGAMLGGGFAILLGLAFWMPWRQSRAAPHLFSGAEAFVHVSAQMGFGPRVTGSPANLAAGQYIGTQLGRWGWEVEYQKFWYRETEVRSVIGRANRDREPVVIVGAHYDSRRRADRDKILPDRPVPGANDGASGVAVLLELARVLNVQDTPYEVWLAFFDAEDNGGLDGWDSIVGSSYMAEHLTITPTAMILVDMVGDADQRIYFDRNSDAVLSQQLWAIAANLGYGDHFIAEPRWAMLDDHIPFARRGIPAVDIIDFDYGPANGYWHTTADTIDKVNPASLERVGRTLIAFLQTPPK